MKFTKITLSVALLGAFTLGMAADIDVQIEKIQNAPAQERVELMNEFKQQLANMNKEDRMQAISQMQEKMQAHAQENMQEGKQFGSDTHKQAQGERDHMQEMGENTRQRAQDMAHSKQAETMEHMNQIQNMNQMQAGDQMNHMMEMHGNNGGGMSGGDMSGQNNH